MAYPTSIDSFPVVSGEQETEGIHADLENDQSAAIAATQTELGLDPSGSFASVQARLAAIPVVPALVEGKWLKAEGGAMTWADVPSFTLPGRLAGGALQITNWNLAVDNGWYFSAPGVANAPDASNWYLGRAEGYSATTWVDQTVWAFVAGLYRYRYRRQMNGSSTWSAWISDPITYRGAYAAGTAYAPGEIVAYAGRYWMAMNNNVNVTPA